MTTRRTHRCIHCRDRYIYQGSGFDTPKFNSSEYCPSCAEAVSIALFAIPVKWTEKWKPVTDGQVTYEMLATWAAEEAQEPSTNFLGLKPRQIFVGLFDLETGAATHSEAVNGRGEFRHRRFRWTKWSDDREPVQIEELGEIQTSTGIWFRKDYGFRPDRSHPEKQP